LPYKPGALHPVASAPLKALTCFRFSPLLAEKDKPFRAKHVMAVDFTTRQDDRPGAFNKQLATAA